MATALTILVSNGDTITWSAPEATPAGGSPAVTGYEVWEETSPGVWALDQSLGVVTEATVSAGTYAVRALYSGGRSGLSDPVTTNDWLESLPAVTAGNTIENTMTEAQIQTELDGLSAGDVRYFEAGTYSHSASSTFLDLGNGGTVNGTASNYITILPVPGDTVILEGVGWTDDEASSPASAQRLLEVTGDYWRVYGFEIRDSGWRGIEIVGSNCHIEEIEAYDCWHSGINVGDTDGAEVDVDNNLIQYCISRHSKQGSGWGLRVDDGSTYRTDGNIYRRNIGYSNGFNSSDGDIDVYGGGNSDAGGSSKFHHDNVTLGSPPPAVTTWPTGNRGDNNQWLQNIGYRNGDDGYDGSTGDGTLMMGNIFWHNFPSGTKGAKQLREHWGTWTVTGNVMIGSDEPQWGTDVIYFNNGSSEIFAAETIDGLTSGASATVDEVKKFTNAGGSWAGGDAEGAIMISGLSGAFQFGEDIEISSVKHAEVRNSAQSIGLDFRIGEYCVFFDSGGTTAIVADDVVTGGTSGASATVLGATLTSGSWVGGDAAGWLRLHTQTGTWQNNEAIEISAADRATVFEAGGLTGFPTGQNKVGNATTLRHLTRGIGHGGGDSDLGELRGSLSYYNGSSDFTPGITADNHLNTEGTAPGIHTPTYEVPSETLTGALIRDQWRNLYRDVMENIMATDGGNLENGVVLDTDYHHTTAADHATTPSDPGDLTKLHWFGSSPDIGASQFMELWPPVVTVSASGSFGRTPTTARRAVLTQ